jgi:glyoxylase-like metal-dependent hydrolase (beta-lactamase superfamily II)
MIAFLLMLGQTAVANPDSLLTTVRALGGAIPGELPTAVSYLNVYEDSGVVGNSVDGAGSGKVLSVTGVFQVRFRHGWVMIDAAMDSSAMHRSHGFKGDNFAKIETALEKANLIVITHEHIDHVATLVKSPIADQVAPHTMLTREQVETLLTKPKVAFTSMDSAQVSRYLVVEYERALPIAPGVVLIKAPGHTPGSQMVYVKLASGKEMIFAGDIAWRLLGVETQKQKPDSTSQRMSEDRSAIAKQLAWLKDMKAQGISVVVSHDGTELQTLAKQGLLSEGLLLQ